MASSIKETPTLVGSDARRFNEKIKANESKKVSPEESSRVMVNYQKIRKLAK